MDKQTMSQVLLDIFQRLMAHYGPQHWWPADEPLEVIVGAILTQSAAWRNVEKAITNLKLAKALSTKALRHLPAAQLAILVHPSGYYNAKAIKLKNFAHWLEKYYNDSLGEMFASDTSLLRQQLLDIPGVGQETADSILLYAAGKPIFVIDAYTHRILSRLGLVSADNSYTFYQSFFMNSLPTDAELFNEYHALLVHLAKDACHKHPLCPQCCLSNICYLNTKESA